MAQGHKNERWEREKAERELIEQIRAVRMLRERFKQAVTPQREELEKLLVTAERECREAGRRLVSLIPDKREDDAP